MDSTARGRHREIFEFVSSRRKCLGLGEVFKSSLRDAENIEENGKPPKPVFSCGGRIEEATPTDHSAEVW